jgi:aspartyl-tRNA synthetase
MVAGFERYFQLARCFRDEDLRSDRQPEFTQIDMEMSFVKPEKIFRVVEGLMEEIFRVAGKTLHRPYPVLDYNEAMSRYGSDKPDFRFGMEIVDLTGETAGTEWPVLRDGVGTGAVVRGLVLEEQAGLSRKQIDDLGEFGRGQGLARLFWLPWKEEAGPGGAVFRHLGESIATRMLERAAARAGDGLLFVCEPRRKAEKGLGALRLHLGEQFGLRQGDEGRMLWVTNFPCFERDESSGDLSACHHPFTSPVLEDLDKLDTAPEEVRARAYDLVLDGEEIGGGSIRIHQREVQERVFRVLGITPQQAAEKFGFLLQALRFGAPPHGGIALGFDRIISILTGARSLRDVIAFPKTSSAFDLMTGSPSPVDDSQLGELHISLRPSRKDSR